MPLTDISSAIADVSEQLTPTERKIAQAVINEPTLLAFGTVTDLADLIGTSRPSIVRFASKLGFDGYPDLQETARTGLAHQVSRPSERVRTDRASGDGDLETLADALGALSGVVDAGKLGEVAPLISDARAVWIVSGETSKASAHVLRSGLGIVRPDVHMLEDHTIGRDLTSAGPADVAILSDFPRYRRSTMVAAQTLRALDVPIIAVTDGPLSPLAALAAVLIEVSVPAVGLFDSSVPSVALAELIVAEVGRINRTAVQDRVDRTEELWRQTATFIDQE